MKKARTGGKICLVAVGTVCDEIDDELIIIGGDTYENVFAKWKEAGYNIDGLCAAYVSSIPKFGDKDRSRKIWVLIGRDQSTMFAKADIKAGIIRNDITAIVYADSRSEADELLRSHPAHRAIVMEAAGGTSKRVDDYMSVGVLDFIFGDYGDHCSTFIGNMVEVPIEHHHLF